MDYVTFTHACDHLFNPKISLGLFKKKLLISN